MINGEEREDNNEQGKKEILLEVIITDHLGCFVFRKVLVIIYSFAFRWNAVAVFTCDHFALFQLIN